MLCTLYLFLLLWPSFHVAISAGANVAKFVASTSKSTQSVGWPRRQIHVPALYRRLSTNSIYVDHTRFNHVYNYSDKSVADERGSDCQSK